MILEENTFEQNLSIAQNLDPEIVKIKEELGNKEDKYYEMRNGLLYRKYKDTILFYVPKNMENEVIRHCHDSLGHVGINKTCEYLNRVYYFPKIKEKVINYIRNCLKCITYSPVSGKSPGVLHSIPKGNVPFATLHIDHYGPLEKTSSGKKYVFEVIDGFTKYVKLYSVKSTKTIEVVNKLKEYFTYYSRPVRIVSDRGTSFTSKEFSNFLVNNNISHVKVASASPKSNGQIERINRDLTPMLSKLDQLKNKWDKYLSEVEFVMNNTYSRSINNSPSILLFGVNQRDRNDDLRTYLEFNKDNHVQDLVKIRTDAVEQMKKLQNYNKEKFDQSHKEPLKYELGDYVMVKNVDVTPGINKKLLPKYRGPYEIKKFLIMIDI